jgi:hypothetical protein
MKSQLLNAFCAKLRENPNCALNALLKIAEAKKAILDWKQELSMTLGNDCHETIRQFIAVEQAMLIVDSAEVSILDAFCLQQQGRSRPNRLGVRQRLQTNRASFKVLRKVLK